MVGCRYIHVRKYIQMHMEFYDPRSWTTSVCKPSGLQPCHEVRGAARVRGQVSFVLSCFRCVAILIAMPVERIALVLVGTLLAGALHAQAFPTRPVRFIVPFSPGGAPDTAARIVGTK